MLQAFFLIKSSFGEKIVHFDYFCYNWSMKKFQRWYEKNECLKAFMELLQDLPMEIQCEVAIDIIMKASEMSERDYTKIIREVASYNPQNYKRWYDKNPNVHLAIESLRELTEEQKEEVIQEFSERIIKFYYISADEIEQI